MSLATMAQKQASSTLKKFGAKGTLSHSTPGAYDPATGGASATVTNTTVNALLDSSSSKALGFKFGDGLVQGGDMLATIAGTAESGDTLTLSVGVFTVIAVRPLYVADAVVTSECLVRK